MQPPRVSVVVPAFNAEKLIERCLESLKNQTVSPYEIIVVDNNSTDRTAAIAEQYGVIVVKESRQGIAWARDAGFLKASGDIIARCDADCVTPKTWVETITKYYSTTPTERYKGITGSGYYTTKSELLGKILGTLMTEGYNMGNRLMTGSVSLYGSCMAFPRNWWDEVKEEVCHDSHVIHEDIDISVHLLNKGFKITKVKQFYTYIDARTLREPFKKTWWRWRSWPPSAFRHRNDRSN